MVPYNRFRLALYGGGLALLIAWLMIDRLPAQSQPTIVIFALLGAAVVGFTYGVFVRCPVCRTSLFFSVMARALRGKIHECAKCHADLRTARSSTQK